MNEQFHVTLIGVLNDWYDNLDTSVEIQPVEKYEFSKSKFRDRYFQKTGENLRLSKSVESQLFSKIYLNLSKKYNVTEELIDNFLDWCFDNYVFFVRKYGEFCLNSCVKFSADWDIELLNYKSEDKTQIHNITEEDAAKSIFYNFEKFGIPIFSTYFCDKNKISKNAFESKVKEKLSVLLKKQSDMNRLANMLRKTVENAPYDESFLFHDYKHSLKEFYKYFKKEPWCPK